MIVAQTLTDQDTDDASQVGPLLDRIGDPIARVTADGAYDGVPSYQTIAAHGDGIDVVIPPRSTAVARGGTGPALTARPPSGDDHGTGPTGLAGRPRGSCEGFTATPFKVLLPVRWRARVRWKRGRAR